MAVFDWEMCALGDPLVDVGILLVLDEERAAEHRDALTSITDRPGWFTRGEIVERYATLSGRDLSTFISTRHLPSKSPPPPRDLQPHARGQTDHSCFAHFDVRVAHLARQGRGARGTGIAHGPCGAREVQGILEVYGWFQRFERFRRFDCSGRPPLELPEPSANL